MLMVESALVAVLRIVHLEIQRFFNRHVRFTRVSVLDRLIFYREVVAEVTVEVA